MQVKVVSGANTNTINVDGDVTVQHVYDEVKTLFNLPDSPQITVDGAAASMSSTVFADSTVEFSKAAGRKGA